MSKIYNRAQTDHPFRAVGMHAAQAGAVDLMEAAVGAYALIAYADGEAVEAERREFFATLRRERAMAVFSREDVAAEMSLLEAAFRFDPLAGEGMAFARIAGVAHRGAAKGLLLQTCAQVMHADGVAHPEECRQLAIIDGLLDSANGAARR